MTKTQALEMLRVAACGHGMTLDMMANRSGLYPSRIARMLEGKEYCSDADLRLIAKCLGYTVSFARVTDCVFRVADNG